mmetsp:Transcript_19136/g.28981  ORF Transcript_19136/g.28981 Transcript_19136/m.28981 type:complete len:541 (-) Transcript_19136:241-1863(-)
MVLTRTALSNTSKTSAESEKYLSRCATLGISPDASVLVTLECGWELLAPSVEFGRGSLLPLKEVLQDENCGVRRLVLRSSRELAVTCPTGECVSSDARVLRQALEKNRSITDLDLANCGLRHVGILELAAALKVSPSVRRVNFQHNSFGKEACEALRDAIIDGKRSGTCGLEELDLSMNGLGYTTVQLMRAAVESLTIEKKILKDQQLIIHLQNGNYTTEELLNALTHGIGCLIAFCGAVPLLSDAARSDRATFWQCFIYTFTLVFCFGSSCAYHACFKLPRAFKYLQRCDHAGIYLLIAGSYTPFMACGMRGHLGATILLVLVWIAAFMGSLAAAAGVGLQDTQINPAEVTVYAAMGLSVLPIISDVHETFPPTAFLLLVLGGASYLIGIYFFVAGNRYPMLHVVWHLFVLCGAFAHWYAVYLFIIPMMTQNSYPQTVNTDHLRAQLQDYHLTESLLSSLADSKAVAKHLIQGGRRAQYARRIFVKHILPSLLAFASTARHHEDPSVPDADSILSASPPQDTAEEDSPLRSSKKDVGEE